eukprot:scaffold246_cov414-Prasinococcus_capsulatus_cf.AAC.28
MALSDPETSRLQLKEAADLLVSEFLCKSDKDNLTVAFGTGLVASLCIDAVAERLKDSEDPLAKKAFFAVPTTPFSAARLATLGIQMHQDGISAGTEHVDICIVEVDELSRTETGDLAAIKARPSDMVKGHDGLYEETSLAHNTNTQIIVLAHESQLVPQLGGVLPVEIEAKAWLESAEEIDDMFLGDATLWRRPRTGTANPLGKCDKATRACLASEMSATY